MPVATFAIHKSCSNRLRGVPGSEQEPQCCERHIHSVSHFPYDFRRLLVGSGNRRTDQPAQDMELTSECSQIGAASEQISRLRHTLSACVNRYCPSNQSAATHCRDVLALRKQNIRFPQLLKNLFCLESFTGHRTPRSSMTSPLIYHSMCRRG
jgi:hypothetical protein